MKIGEDQTLVKDNGAEQVYQPLLLETQRSQLVDMVRSQTHELSHSEQHGGVTEALRRHVLATVHVSAEELYELRGVRSTARQHLLTSWQ